MPNRTVVSALLRQDINAILEYDFKSILSNSDFAYTLLNKFTVTVHANKTNEELCEKMFNWFKLMIYYALEDSGYDAPRYIETMCKDGRGV